MTGEEAKRRGTKVLKVVIIVGIIIVAAAFAFNIYNTYLKPPEQPIGGPKRFRYSETATVSSTDAGLSFGFEYTPVSGQNIVYMIIFNVTNVEKTGSLEIRAINAWLRDIKEPVIEEFEFTPSEAGINLKEGEVAVGVTNWGFAGTLQFIIFVEAE